MSFVSKAAGTIVLSFSLFSLATGCSNDDAKPDLVADKELTSVPLPSGDGSNGAAPPSGPNGATPPPAGEPPPSPGDGTSPPGPPVPPPLENLRGTNLVGMEGDYGFDQASGPVADRDYAVHANAIVDYLVTKNVNVLRFLFSWERMQPTLGGPIPATTGNYKGYYDNYKRIVDYATSKGMTVVVSPWQPSSSGGAGGARYRGNLVGGGTVTTEHFADFWSKMATTYADNPRVAINLVNEPNGMSTMAWFGIAQAAVTAIRDAGFTGDIYVPGNGWTGAASWNDSSYDTASPKRSNAYGWLNARGPGQPLLDPLGRSIVEVHSYADSDASGSSTEVVSTTATRTRVKGVVEWARANALRVWIGEIGMYADASNAKANWNDFAGYASDNTDALVGYAWWACGKPGWWNDVGASNGGHFSITPTNDYTTDTVNMKMIETAFGK
jgi:endoglucanase